MSYETEDEKDARAVWRRRKDSILIAIFLAALLVGFAIGRCTA